MARPYRQPPVICEFFTWHIRSRSGVYYADGRFNALNLKTHSLGTRDYATAMQALKQLDRKMAIENGRLSPAAAPCASDLEVLHGWDLYLADRKKPLMFGGVSDGTYKRYRSVQTKHISFCKRHSIAYWQQIDAQNTEAYGLSLRKKGYADRSVYLEVNAIKTIVNWLIDTKRLTQDRRIVLPLVKPDGCEAYCYTIEQVSDIVVFCRGNPGLQWLADVIVGLACTGLRISEFASLRWTDVDVKAEVLRLTDERWSHRRRVIGSARHTKGKRTRCLPIHPELLAVIAKLKPSADGLIFHGPAGRKLSDTTVRANLVDRVIARLKHKYPAAVGEVGFQDGRVHSLRHYFCSESFRNGATEAELLQWLGHSDSKMVAHYRHLRADDSKRRMQQMRLLDLDPGVGQESAYRCTPGET